MASSTCGARSRFAVLKIEDDEDEDDKEKWTLASNKKSGAKLQSQTKSNKQKKKKNPSQSAGESHQHVVGLQPVSSRDSASLADSIDTQNTQSKSADSKQKVNVPCSKENEDWKAHDEQYVAEAYISDLKSAIVQSREEFKKEQKLNKLREAQISSQCTLGNSATNANTAQTDAGSKKSKKQKKKQQGSGDKKIVMSLDEFQQGNGNDSNAQDQSKSASEATASSTPEDEVDPFHIAEKEVSKIVDKERRQDALKQTLKEESTLRNQYKHEVDKRNAKIKQLLDDLKQMQGEMGEIKKRNKLLCKIMMEGEMKDKAQVLKQVEDLSQVRDELTAQVTQLHADLEKERSRSSKLEEEIKRLQSKRHA